MRLVSCLNWVLWTSVYISWSSLTIWLTYCNMVLLKVLLCVVFSWVLIVWLLAFHRSIVSSMNGSVFWKLQSICFHICSLASSDPSSCNSIIFTLVSFSLNKYDCNKVKFLICYFVILLFIFKLSLKSLSSYFAIFMNRSSWGNYSRRFIGFWRSIRCWSIWSTIFLWVLTLFALYLSFFDCF